MQPDSCFSFDQYSNAYYIQLDYYNSLVFFPLFLFSFLFFFPLRTQILVFSHKSSRNGLAECIKKRVIPMGPALHTCLFLMEYCMGQVLQDPLWELWPNL